MTDDDAGRGRPSKVARAIDRYGLDGLGAELEAAWTAPEPDRSSLRDLADLVNRRIVESALARAGDRPLQGEVETVTRALAGEAAGATERDVSTRLESLDIDASDLAGDLVSYQAVRTYLTGVRGAEYEAPERVPTAASRDRIRGLQGRLRAVAAGELAALADRGEIALGDSRVLVQVQVYCEDCGRQFDVDELLERGGCDCD